MNPDSTHLSRWIQIWIEKYATGRNPRVNGALDTIDYVPRIHSSHAPIVIVDFATAHPGSGFLLNFVLDSSSWLRFFPWIPALLTEGLG